MLFARAQGLLKAEASLLASICASLATSPSRCAFEKDSSYSIQHKGQSGLLLIAARRKHYLTELMKKCGVRGREVCPLAQLLGVGLGVGPLLLLLSLQPGHHSAQAFHLLLGATF